MTALVVPAAEASTLDVAAAALGRGAVIAIPTETVYGVAALPLATSLERLVAIKRRSSDKGIALLIDSVEQMRSHARVPEAAQRLAEAFWPGPLTLVLDILPEVALPELLTGGRRTVALRLPDHDVPRTLCRRLGPICASSANISGQPDATTAGQVLTSLGSDLELIVDDGPVRGGRPSTVVGFDAADRPVVLREGALSTAEIMAAAG